MNATARVRELSARVLTIQEDERCRISRDLHDDIGQSLTALRIGLHRLTPLLRSEALVLLGECAAIADETLDRVRRLAYDLRPPQLDVLGFEEGLRWLVERQRAATGSDISCHFNGLLRRRLPPVMEGACYRIAQEALSNACRHAGAGSILVTVEAGARILRLTVRDDGRGFDARALKLRAPRTESLGLVSMSERAKLAGGRLEIVSAAGLGAMVRAVFRLDPPPAR